MRYYAVFKNGKLVVVDKSVVVFSSKRVAMDNLFGEEEAVEVTITKKEEK